MESHLLTVRADVFCSERVLAGQWTTLWRMPQNENMVYKARVSVCVGNMLSCNSLRIVSLWPIKKSIEKGHVTTSRVSGKEMWLSRRTKKGRSCCWGHARVATGCAGTNGSLGEKAEVSLLTVCL